MAEPVLCAERIGKTFHDGTRELTILAGLDFSLAPGETVAVLGRSGTGKSTLLNLLGLLDRPTEGTIRLHGRDVNDLSERERTTMRARHIGFVFQHYHLLDDLTALENVALAGAVGGLGGDHRDRAVKLLVDVGLAERAGHTPPRLSGGERQRAAIARALMCRPELLLCDEPTGNLDPDTGRGVLDRFWQLVRDNGTALVLVTHDREIARKADRVLVLSGGKLQLA